MTGVAQGPGAGCAAWASARTVRLHALGWLAAACSAGLLLQALQLYPNLNDTLGALTYGRWFPVHANAALYGWCAVPLAGVLLRWYWPGGAEARGHVSLALAGWTLAIAGGAAGWLLGETNGKPFMEWAGGTEALLPLAMIGLWVLLASWTEARRAAGEYSGAGFAARCLVLAALLPVPFVFVWAAAPEVYPAINPDSGGATGTSLLGSTLGFVAIYGAAPALLGLPPAAGRARMRIALAWCAWCLSMGVFATAGHGDVSHHELRQQVSLGVLLLWAPLSWLLFRSYRWPGEARGWLAAAFLWWCLLLASGWLGFLPGMSERFKFTQILVAHAHLAMAGCVGSLGWVLLICLGGGGSGRWRLALWQAGTALHIGATAWAGWREISEPGALFLGDAAITAAWTLRLLAGATLAGVALSWWLQAARAGNGSERDCETRPNAA